MEEVGLRDTVDPLAGSYFIETLTKQMEEKIGAEMKEVEDFGGIVKAVAQGYIQKKVSRQAYEFEKAVQDGELIKVGVNKYVEGEEEDVALHEYREESAEEKIQALKELRRERSSLEVTRTLKALESAVEKKKNVMPLLVDCCQAYCTVGEMTQVFKNAFGEFEEPNIF
jgi:methylmalonyl-CoA mutase N-terminal domain/subunit